MATTEQDSPEYKCPAYTEMAVGWDKVRAVRHLNKTLAESPGSILPKFESEDLIDYMARTKITDVFEAVDETIHALVGLATRHAPVLGEDVPARIRLDWEDLDGQGTHGDVFVQHLLDAALQDGHAGVLTDYPPAPRGMTLAQEQAGGYRAYAVLLPADRVTSWRVGRVQGRMMLTMVKLRESREVESGLFGNTTVERYRTLFQRVAAADGEVDGVKAGEPYVAFMVHEPKDGKSGEWIIVDQGVIRGPKHIPVRIAYGGERTGILRSRPPLRGLAYTSVAHTQVGSDLRSSMNHCSMPMTVFIGRDKSGDSAGDNAIKKTNGIDVGVNGDVKMVEPSGVAFEALERYRENLKRQMVTQGFAMLRREAAGDTTATEALLQSSKESSKLSKALRSVNDAMEGAFEDFAAFYGLPDGGSITMVRQFTDLELTVDQIRVMKELQESGDLTLETTLLQIQKHSRLLEGVDIPKEIASLKLAEANASDPIPPADLVDLEKAA